MVLLELHTAPSEIRFWPHVHSSKKNDNMGSIIYNLTMNINIQLIILQQLELVLVQVRCTILDAWGWCTGMTQRDGMGKEEGGGLRMGNTCIPVADSFWYMAKPIQYCKVKIKFKKNMKWWWFRMHTSTGEGETFEQNSRVELIELELY